MTLERFYLMNIAFAVVCRYPIRVLSNKLETWHDL